MPDFFSAYLLEARFRGIGFPVSEFHLNVSQDLAEHKRPDQDGALVEATGRNPIRFSATIPFIQGLARGPNESWTDIYPDRHKAFLAAMASRETGKLQHPSFGEVTVKPVSVQSTLSADRRQGEVVQAEWVEATEIQNDSNALFQQNPFAAGAAAALALDDVLDRRPDIKKKDPDPRISLSEAFNRLVAVFDTATLLVRRGIATIGAFAYRINTLHRAVVSLADPKTWAVRRQFEILNDSLLQMKRLGMGQNGAYSFYVVPRTMTVGELAALVNHSVGELLSLNPFLSNKANVERGVAIRRFNRVNMNDANRITPTREKFGRPV